MILQAAAQSRRARTKTPAALLAALPLLPGAVGLAASPVVHAQEPVQLTPIDVLTGPSGLRMDSQSAIGSRLGLAVDEQPGTVDVIDQQRMQQRGDRTTTEAVTSATGFTSANTGGNLSQFSARGFDDVAILYDGISFGTPGMFARPQGTWIYDRVETISGPASILHGEGAIVGAVDFVPRRPDPNVTSTDVLFSAGSFNSSRVAAGHGGPTGVEGLSFRLDGERQSSDGYPDNANLRRDTVSGSLLYEASERLTLSGNLVYVDDSLPPYWGTTVDPERGEPPRDLARSNFNARDATVLGEEFRLTLDADYRASARVQLRNRLYAYRGKRDWVNVESSEFDDGEVTQRFAFSLDNDQTFFGNRSEALMSHELFGLDARSSAGVEVSRDDFASDRSPRPNIDRDVGDPSNPDTGSVGDINFDRSEQVLSTKRDTLALFGENRLALGGGFNLISGVRGELIRLDTEENITEDGEFARDSETFTTGDARLGFVWDATPGLSLFGQASTGSQFALNPNIPQIDQFDRDLERSRAFEAGLRGEGVNGRLEWQVVVFDIEKRNRLVSDPDDPQRQRQVGRRTSQGIEVSGYAQVTRQLALEANATVLNAELRDEAELGGNTPANVPERLANLWATWEVTPAATARAHLRYVGEAEANNANTQQIPSYTLLNLSSSYALDDHWEVTGRVRNVTDELYYTQAQFGPQYYVGDGRSFELELSASF